MLWLTPPPHVRRLAAGLAVVVALGVDLAGSPTVEHPFLTSDVAAGAAIGPEVVELRPVPEGLLPAVPDPTGFAATALHAGDPLVPSALAPAAPPPDGWWAIRTPLPHGVVTGTPVRLIAADTDLDVVGVVTGVGDVSVLGGEAEGAVAVPPETAPAVAAASARGALTVLIGT